MYYKAIFVSKFVRPLQFVRPLHSDTLKGLVKDIIVHPVMGLNRDGINKQLGHKLNITFKLPIVNDKLIWNNKIDKISGYTIENGQSTYETENIPINIGGRPKKKV